MAAFRAPVCFINLWLITDRHRYWTYICYLCVRVCMCARLVPSLHASLLCTLRLLTSSLTPVWQFLHKHSMYGDFDFDGLIEVSGVTGFIYLGQLRLIFILVSFTRNCPEFKAWVADWPCIHWFLYAFCTRTCCVCVCVVCVCVSVCVYARAHTQTHSHTHTLTHSQDCGW